MARKEAMLLSSVLSALLLLMSDVVATNNLEKSNSTVANNTKIVYAASQANSRNSTNATVTVESTARLAKTFSVKTVKNGFDTVHKSDSYPSWTTNTNNGTYKPVITRREDKKNQSSASLTDAIREMTNRRVSVLKKYPTRYSTTSSKHQELENPSTDRALVYGVHPDDYETQAQNYDAEYFPAPNHEYEENYNSLPDDQSGSGYEDAALKDPYRISYMSQDPGFFGPPITMNPYYQDLPAGGGGSSYYQDNSGGGTPSYYQQPPGVVSLSSPPGCNCKRATRQFCNSPFSDFLSLAGDLGGNIWSLGQLIGTTAAPFVIPLLALKMIIVPLKILKFLNLVKIFLKLFIILPFFVRYVFPTLSNWTASLPGLFMQQLQNIFPMSGQNQQSQHPLLNKPHKPRPYEEIVEDDEEEVAEEDLESRGGANDTYPKDQFMQMDDSSMWDLRACPSRVACELGAFLGGSADYRSFPKNLASYLARKADRVEGRRMNDSKAVKSDKSDGGKKNAAIEGGKKKGDREEHDYEEEDDDDDEDEEDELQRNAVYKAFILALVRKWNVEKCQTYNCPVLF